MLVGQALKLIVQALYFGLIARSLGAKNYGAFVGAVGLVGILLPFATLGSGYLLIKIVAQDHRQFPRAWGRALLTTLLAASALFVIVIAAARFALPASIPLQLVIMVAASDLFGTSIAGLCGHAFIAFEQMQWTASINVLLSVLRLAAAAIVTTYYVHPAALDWGRFYLGSTAAVTALALGLVFVKLGAPQFNFSHSGAETRDGLYFSISLSAQTIYNDIDKTMLARLGTLEAAGIYGAAYRVIDVSFAPVWSLLAAAYPNFFRVGAGGIAATLRFAKPLIFRGLGYAILALIALLAGAGIVPLILGSGYRPTEEALRWLAVLIPLKVIHFFLSDALVGAGYPGVRTLLHGGVAIFNVLINLWIIPAYSWRGAAWSSIASDALLACAVGAAVSVLSHRPRPLAAQPEILEVRTEA